LLRCAEPWITAKGLRVAHADLHEVGTDNSQKVIKNPTRESGALRCEGQIINGNSAETIRA
tara:strand:+ start:646 stop:828 length:183 start_codon:yes stop_codon:yes gene_type:complete